jgi:hypothetical protein
LILNASRSGLCIEALHPIEQGQSVFLTIKLTGRVGRILGHARWCRQASGRESKPAVFRIGIELISPIEESWLTALMRPSRADRFRPSRPDRRSPDYCI